MSEHDPLQPLRDETARLGFEPLRSPEEVERAAACPGTAVLYVDSVCACAAENARPGLARFLEEADPRPDHLWSCLAGADAGAVLAARRLLRPHRPSAPQIALLRDGELVRLFQRADLEGRSPDEVAAALADALQPAS